MSNHFIKKGIKNLNEDGLYLLYKDVVNRIGSHFIGSSPDPNYVKQQESILNLIQDELLRRNKENALCRN